LAPKSCETVSKGKRGGVLPSLFHPALAKALRALFFSAGVFVFIRSFLPLYCPLRITFDVRTQEELTRRRVGGRVGLGADTQTRSGRSPAH